MPRPRPRPNVTGKSLCTSHNEIIITFRAPSSEVHVTAEQRWDDWSLFRVSSYVDKLTGENGDTDTAHSAKRYHSRSISSSSSRIIHHSSTSCNRCHRRAPASGTPDSGLTTCRPQPSPSPLCLLITATAAAAAAVRPPCCHSSAPHRAAPPGFQLLRQVNSASCYFRPLCRLSGSLSKILN